VNLQLESRSPREGLELAGILPKGTLVGCSSVRFRSCCGKWDECEADDLYVAIVGADEDGHDFARQAVERGAAAIVTERLLAVDVPQILVNDSRQAYGEVCHALAGHPGSRLTNIGVSGTDGKTITSHLIASILEVAGHRTGIHSSIGVRSGGNGPIYRASSPNPPLFAQQLSRMVMEDCSHAVTEISCRDLTQYNHAGIQLDVAVLTNMRETDLDFHVTRENHRRSQLRLLGSLKPEGVAVLNLDDPVSHFLVDQCPCPTLTVGIHQDGDVKGRLLERLISEQTFMITAGSESALVKSPMIGDEHIYNCLCATAACLAMGIDLQSIAKGLEAGSMLPGRLENLKCGQEFGVWVDAANSASQLATAIGTIKQVVKGRVWSVCSVDEELSSAQRKQIGEIVERAADHVVATRTTAEPILDYEPMHQFLDGFEHPHSVQMVPNRFRAIEWALGRAKPGDGVLVAGCGEKPFALSGDQDWAISDRDVCEAWLYDQASPEKQSDPRSNTFNIDDYR